VTYGWSTLDTVRICTPTFSHVIPRSDLSIGRRWYNPHLPRRSGLLRTREYGLPGVEISEHWRVNIREVGRGVVTRRRSIVLLYEGESLWRRFDFLRFCYKVQEVESKDKSRKERVNS